MKKKLGIWCMLFFITCATSIQPVVAEDEEEDNNDKDIVLVYHLEAAQFVSLALAVEGAGSVIDGTQEIRNGINLYDIRTDEEKTFEVRPDPGNEVASISINGQEVRGRTNDIITIKGAEEDTQVKVLFETKQGPIVSSPSNSDFGIYTGDQHNEGRLWFCFIIAGFLIVSSVMRNKRKKHKPF